MKFLLLCLWLMSSFLCSQALKDDPQVDADKLKKALDELENKLDNSQNEGLQLFMVDLAPALASDQEAVKFYQKCKKRVDFEGIKGEGPEWTEWLSKNQAMMSDPYFLKWNGMQLRFLDLWSQAHASKDITSYEESLIQFCFEITDSLLKYEKEKASDGKKPDFRSQSIQQGLSSTVYVKAYRLEGLFKEKAEWNLTLSQPESILEKLLMDRYRSEKNVRLFAIWDKRIEWAELRGKVLSLKKEDQFQLENQVLEQQWKIATDYRNFGLQNKGINLMYSILSKAPDHPQFEPWVKELRSLLEGKKQEPTK